MKKAVFLTAFNRLSYLQQVLHTWENVRGAEDWDFVAMIEPSQASAQMVEEFEEFGLRTNFRKLTIQVNPQVYGVLHHPWVGFETLFSDIDIGGNYDFVVRAEDDLIVSDDILEFFSWAAEEHAGDPWVATAHAFSQANGDPSEVELSSEFSPWVWGTWQDRWQNLIGPTWDHDYSTFNGSPGHQSGWDWNLDTRIFPQHNLRSARPVVSRTNNIGVHGTHGTAQNFVQSEHFWLHQEPVAFRSVDSR